uniref:Uncharacterized protein n=1 Tax=Opuntia streptacantha TaxID=393608 RepID=A0A7C9DTY2_OPUST
MLRNQSTMSAWKMDWREFPPAPFIKGKMNHELTIACTSSLSSQIHVSVQPNTAYVNKITSFSFASCQLLYVTLCCFLVSRLLFCQFASVDRKCTSFSLSSCQFL